MIKTPQPGYVTFRVLYTHHVGLASAYERQAEAAMAKWKDYYLSSNPDASPESIEIMVSERHEVKSLIGKQQFHTREATKYGLGMVVEAMGCAFSIPDTL